MLKYQGPEPQTDGRLLSRRIVGRLVEGRLLILLWLGVGIIAFSACQSKGVFRPTVDNATPGADFNGFPVTATLPQLAANPMAYLNLPVRVSGQFTVKEQAACDEQQRGPSIFWSLVADDWQLNVIGMGELPSRLPEGTPLTLDGIFQQYTGPVGCGKRPPAGSVWYLRVLQVVDPNPLPLVNGLLAQIPVESERVVTEAGLATPTEGEGNNAIPPATDPNPGGYPAPIGSATPTPPGGELTSTPPTATATATATSTPTSTPTPGTPPATVEGAEPTPTSPAGVTPTPALPPPTATPGGYPPFPTVTPRSYP